MADIEMTAGQAADLVDEDSLDSLVAGYPNIAGHMGRMPPAAMFRSFATMGMQFLLYRQAELIDIEKRLRHSERVDKQDSSQARQRCSEDWRWLAASEQQDVSGDQFSLVQYAMPKLKEYHEALIQQSAVTSLPAPNKHDLKYMQNHLMTSGLPLIGPDKTVWGSYKQRKAYSADLVAIQPRHHDDWFSKWFAGIVLRLMSVLGACMSSRKPKKTASGIIGVEEKHVLQGALWLTSILASVLPIASITVLYCVSTMRARLVVIAIFNLLVSVCLATFTNAKRSEVFAVTSAFAAVQVVFVGTNGAIGEGS